MNDNKNDNKTRPAGLFIGVAAVIVFLALGGAVWMEGPRHGWSRDTRIIIELSLAVGLLIVILLIKCFEFVLLSIASLRASRWLARYDAGKRAASVDHNDQDGPSGPVDRATALRNLLRDRHGWRWRYRERWVLVAGDLPLVKRLAPGLADTGYVINGDTILLYAGQTRDTLETEWLDQIRRLRRYQPIDAIVAVTRNRSSADVPFDVDGVSRQLALHARALRWAAPAYLLDATDFGSMTSSPDEAIGFTWSNACLNADDFDSSLQDLAYDLAGTGVVRLTKDARDRYPVELSQHIANLRSALTGLVLKANQSRTWKHGVHGLLFAPLFKERELALPLSSDTNDDDSPTGPQHRTIWQTVADHSRNVHGRRVGFSPSTAAAWMAIAVIGFWIAGAMLSGFVNRATIGSAADTVSKLKGTQNPTQSLQTLTDLDRQIDTLETHQRNRAPLSARFGLNRDHALLDALWPHYADAANRILVGPIRRQLEARLHQLASLSDAEIASGGDAQVQAAYDTLKTYLMLAKPERAVAAFLTPQLVATSMPARPVNASLSPGRWEDLRQQAITFFTNHLGPGTKATAAALAIAPDNTLIAATRQTVIGVRGIQNSRDAIYQQILDEATPKYPPVSLVTLLGDSASQAGAGSATSRGLFNTTMTIPGVFTRAAWDERIAKAIDEAGEQHDVSSDWVLSDTKAAGQSSSTLKDELRQRYFDDYARAWAQFLNSVRWQPAPTLSATADQLTLLGDPQRSPLVALMNAIVYQAGTGANTQSLSDTLISKAQQLVGADEKDPSKQVKPQLAPLAGAFGPILRLTGSDLVSVAPANGQTAAAQMAATGDLSLARYLERITAMRLKTSQIVSSADPDAVARLAAQSVLQGKTSDIADSRDYASRVAASLGEQWSGFGALFRAPFDQAWQVIVQPAASSLNEIWRAAIVADWNKSFGGRYPFVDSDNDASLPEMARFMRPDGGVITQFVTTQLAGVIERHGDRWVPAQGTDSGALTIDPGFLNGLNKLTRISTVLFPSGDARVRYELQAVPTPGVTDMRFVLSGRELHYFNQKQEWTPFEWPGQSLENLSHIEWQTEQGGLRTALDSQGRFGLIRLFERAKVTQQDNARYLLTWTPDTSQGIPLKVQLRSEAGAGPLDVLQLRNFVLPARIFMTGAASAGPKVSTASPPPLPAAAIAAARHAAVPLPPGLPAAMTWPDEATPVEAGKEPRQTTAIAEARPSASVEKPPTSEPRMALSSLATTSASSDVPTKPFGYALRLLGDVFAFRDLP
ncbi:ImcF-related family protein [Burkholderia metallica]|uniref:ImcF-related family protein n=1 Tax=Burkholderia metallica TaxID=488729 RepID=UPI001CF3D171|nr:ImcF-related family protein [Burkholderia metallica]MCA8016936.1 type VI secretion protein VasK [Burkholderia metallica]